ncbi:MAG: CoA transferase [Pseudomonadota bacterium]
MKKILAGIRILDFSRYVAGPYCATLLGFLGAEVIRVERPGGGDDRDIAPVAEDGTGSVFLQTGCNKKSLCLKLGKPESKPIVDRLIQTADVVVCNFPPPAQQKLGFDYASLKQLKDDIILANVTAFGTTGPLANQGGFDGVAQALSGAMLMTGRDGEPVKSAAPYADYSSAVMLAFGVLAALRERDQSGQGQEVSASLLGTALAVFNSHLVEQSALGLNREGTGNRVQTSGPSDVFATTDGHILVHCPGNAIFKRWTELIGKPEWQDDPRFATDQLRGDHRDILCEPMAHWCAQRSSEESLHDLAAAGVPAGPVLSMQETLAHPQVAALGALSEVSYPGAPTAQVADLPLQFSHSETGIEQRPPTVGEHTQACLSELGFSDAEIAEFAQQQIIA